MADIAAMAVDIRIHPIHTLATAVTAMGITTGAMLAMDMGTTGHSIITPPTTVHTTQDIMDMVRI